MFKTGDMVMHPGAGVCRIDSITEESFGGTTPRKYYVLKTVYDNSPTVIHLPVDSDKIKLRKLLTCDDIRSIIHSVSVTEPFWIENSSERKEAFVRILQEGDYSKMLRMICEIHLQKSEKEKSGKKLYVSDSKVLQAAERIIHQEFAHILEIPPDEVADFIKKELNVG